MVKYTKLKILLDFDEFIRESGACRLLPFRLLHRRRPGKEFSPVRLEKRPDSIRELYARAVGRDVCAPEGAVWISRHATREPRGDESVQGAFIHLPREARRMENLLRGEVPRLMLRGPLRRERDFLGGSEYHPLRIVRLSLGENQLARHCAEQFKSRERCVRGGHIASTMSGTNVLDS